MGKRKKIPDIRFAGFIDDWNQSKLKNVTKDFYNGQTPYRQNNNYWNGDINWLSSGDLNRGIVTHTMEKITEEGKKASGLKIIPKGTLVIAIMGLEAAGTRGNCGILGIDTTINQACMALIVDESFVTTNFLFQWYKCFGNQYALKITQGTKQQNYNAELLGNLDISYPSKREQLKIEAFLSSLDSLITSHQCKYENLVTIKKSMLEKLFPKEGQLYPELRFAGYTDPWKRRKLGDYLTLSTERNSELLYGIDDVFSVSWTSGVVNQIEFQGRSYAGADLSSYDVVHHNEVIYTKSPLRDEPFGIIKTNHLSSGIVSQLYSVYRAADDCDPGFVEMYFGQSARLNNYFRPLVNKGAKNTMNISDEESLAGLVVFPSVEEQQTISKFFTTLDTLITLHKRKMEKLKNIKKALLDKMFV